jgi:hypothetical protein
MYTSELWIKQSTHTPAPKWVKAELLDEMVKKWSVKK